MADARVKAAQREARTLIHNFVLAEAGQQDRLSRGELRTYQYRDALNNFAEQVVAQVMRTLSS